MYQVIGSDERSPPDDELSSFNGRIAGFFSDHSDGPAEIAYLGFRRPGIREALYRAVSAGARTIVCLGAAGLMLPGYSTSVHLPAAVKMVTADNAGLEVLYGEPGLNAHIASSLIMASVERALCGSGTPPHPSWDMPRISSDTGVLLMAAPDYPSASARSDLMAETFAINSRRLSEASKSATIECCSELTRYMALLANCLEATGAFCAVTPGYIDYASPGLEAALDHLITAGSGQVIATAMPALLHRSAFSWTDPTRAIDELKKSRDIDMIYIKPDPVYMSREIAAILQVKALEARVRGTPLRGPPRMADSITF